MKKAVALLLLGLATSFAAYYGLHQQRSFPPFADAVEVIALDHSATAPSNPETALEIHQLSGQDFVLSEPSGPVGALLEAGKRDASREAVMVTVLSHRFFGMRLKVLDPPGNLPWEHMLIRGRAPIKGKHEVAVGAGIDSHKIDIAGLSYEVVGWVRPEITAFRRCALVDASPSLSASLTQVGLRPSRSYMLEGSLGSARRTPLKESLARFKPSEYVLIFHPRHLQFPDFLLYMLGVALLYGGGVLLTWPLIQWLAARSLPSLFRDVVVFLSAHKRRFFIANGSYFGPVVILNMTVYFFPDLQAYLWSMAQGLIRSGTTELGWAGAAYKSGNIAYAAAVTFLINLFIGTIRDITFPSIIVPGVGFLIGLFRGILWGIVLSPTNDLIAHKFKLVTLIEGEAYVLAMLFALQMFLALGGPKGTRWSDYKKAVGLNLKGVLIVAMVLTIAAFIEAITVLVFMKRF